MARKNPKLEEAKKSVAVLRAWFNGGRMMELETVARHIAALKALFSSGVKPEHAFGRSELAAIREFEHIGFLHSYYVLSA